MDYGLDPVKTMETEKSPKQLSVATKYITLTDMMSKEYCQKLRGKQRIEASLNLEAILHLELEEVIHKLKGNLGLNSFISFFFVGGGQL